MFNRATIKDMLKNKGIKWHRYATDVIPLWIADPDFQVASEIKQALIKAVEDEDLFYSNDLETREVMAEKVGRVNNIEASPDNIYITQGVIPGMWLAIKCACEPGDEVIVTDPMYFPFFTAIEVTETKPVFHTLEEEEKYHFNIDVLNELVTPKTRLIFLCNPHNPTGRVLTKNELRGIADIAIDNNLTVMSDELWEDIVFEDRKHISIASLDHEIADRTMTSFGFSKTYGVAGLQIGYIVANNNEIMEKMQKMGRGIIRGTTTLSKAAAIVMLKGKLKWWVENVLKHLHKMKTLAEKRFKNIDRVTCPKLEGTYLMFPNLSEYKISSVEMTEHLLEEGRIAVSSGSRFGSKGEGHVRICIATSEVILCEALNRMEKALSKLN